MNPYKLREIVSFLREQGKNLVTVTGDPVGPTELVQCFGLNEVLTPTELDIVVAELCVLAETENVMDRLRQPML